MSIKVMSAVWEHTTVRGAKLLVLLALADHAKDSGICWPSVPKLAEKARLSRRHTRRILNELQEDGLLARDVRTGPHGANTYKVLTPDRMSPGQPRPPDNRGTPPDNRDTPPGHSCVPRTVIEPSLEEPSGGNGTDDEIAALEEKMGVR